ncbi:MAG: hypothetical protein Q9174_001285 [Haloplaca sp. 1 TL-2023]
MSSLQLQALKTIHGPKTAIKHSQTRVPDTETLSQDTKVHKTSIKDNCHSQKTGDVADVESPFQGCSGTKGCLTGGNVCEIKRGKASKDERVEKVGEEGISGSETGAEEKSSEYTGEKRDSEKEDGSMVDGGSLSFAEKARRMKLKARKELVAVRVMR